MLLFSEGVTAGLLLSEAGSQHVSHFKPCCFIDRRAFTSAVWWCPAPCTIFLTVARSVSHQHPSWQTGVLHDWAVRPTVGSRYYCIRGCTGVTTGNSYRDSDKLRGREKGLLCDWVQLQIPACAAAGVSYTGKVTPREGVWLKQILLFLCVFVSKHTRRE